MTAHLDNPMTDLNGQELADGNRVIVLIPDGRGSGRIASIDEATGLVTIYVDRVNYGIVTGPLTVRSTNLRIIPRTVDDLHFDVTGAHANGASSNDIVQMLDDWFVEQGMPTVIYAP